MSKDKVGAIGNNQNPVEQYLIDKLNRLKDQHKPWDIEEVRWQFEEVLFQFRKHKPLNTPEELKRANEAHALKHRPIRPEIHDRESRKFYNLPPCTCDSSEWGCNYYASRGL